VGGSVRDWLVGCPVKDCDIEVFGVTVDQLTSALARWGKTDLVGRSFGVVKLTLPGGPTFDFTIPRRDSKVEPGHKGFAISFDPAITLEEAAARRDFTINALMYDPRKGNKIAERLSLQGNPAPKEDWYKDPKTGEVFDFTMFARSEGRFAKHFDKDGKPTEAILRSNQERLENWHTLQELAGFI